jgi:hypothetical protein
MMTGPDVAILAALMGGEAPTASELAQEAELMSQMSGANRAGFAQSAARF